MNNTSKPRRGRKGPRPTPRMYRIRQSFQLAAVRRTVAQAAAFYLLVSGIGDFRLTEIQEGTWQVRPIMLGRRDTLDFTIQATDHEAAARELITYYL